jgi:hypothetical protein
MIIDCHGHYTTAPGALQKFRDAQIAGLKEGTDLPLDAQAPISDDEIRESLENAQLKLQRARFFRRVPRPWPITSATRRPVGGGLGPATT